MAVPPFLASYFRYISIPGITDVTDVIPAVRAELVTNPPLDNPPGPAWDEVTTGTFKMPVDADGRFGFITLSVVGADTLRVTVKTASSVTLYDGHWVIDTSGTEVRIYSGPSHLMVESVRTTPECFGIGLLDCFPRPNSYHGNTVWGVVARDLFSNFFNPTADSFASIDNGTPAHQQRIVTELAIAFNTAPLLDASNFTIHHPCMMLANMSGAYRRIGRVCHAYMVDGSLSGGAELEIPINENPLTNGTFKVLGRTTGGGMRMAMRKA